MAIEEFAGKALHLLKLGREALVHVSLATHREGVFKGGGGQRQLFLPPQANLIVAKQGGAWLLSIPWPVLAQTKTRARRMAASDNEIHPRCPRIGGIPTPLLRKAQEIEASAFNPLAKRSLKGTGATERSCNRVSVSLPSCRIDWFHRGIGNISLMVSESGIAVGAAHASTKHREGQLQRDGSIKRPKIGVLMDQCGMYLLQEKFVKLALAFQQPNKLGKRCQNENLSLKKIAGGINGRFCIIAS